MVLNTIRDADLTGKRVLIRVDFNVPLKDGVVKDDTRIRAALPTIEYILSQKGASLVVMSHFGRPKGKKNPEFSMAPIGARFQELLGKPVKVAPDVIGPEVEKEVKALKAGEGARALLEGFLERACDIADMTGLFGQDPDSFLTALRARRCERAGIDQAEVAKILADRAEARKGKDFARSDELRDSLLAIGVQVRDTPEGQTWDLA